MSFPNTAVKAHARMTRWRMRSAGTVKEGHERKGVRELQHSLAFKRNASSG